MSRGKHVEPDDPDWVFVEHPAPYRPRGFELALCGSPLVALLAAGAVWLVVFPVANFAAMAPLTTSRLTLAEFDALRLAADRALAVFRRDFPALRCVGWTRVASMPEGQVLIVHGGKVQGLVDMQRTYVVAADGAVTLAPPDRYASTGYSGGQQRSQTPA
jgi:putative intracellular protease/amidase